MNADQFQQRFLPLREQLVRQALALLGNEADAEDAVQETYLRMWQQSSRIGELGNAEGYFSQTLRNVCLNMLRQRKRVTTLRETAYAYEETEAETPDTAAQLDQVLERLQVKPRRIILMHYFQRMKTQQIAEALGETDANIRSILSRTRNRLRILLSAAAVLLLLAGLGLWSQFLSKGKKEPPTHVIAKKPDTQMLPDSSEGDSLSQPQVEQPKAVAPVKRKTVKRTLPEATEPQPADDIDIAKEMEDIIMNMDQLEQQIISMNNQNE